MTVSLHFRIIISCRNLTHNSNVNTNVTTGLHGWVGHNAFGPTNNWPVCSLILHCGQLILRKISKIGASGYQDTSVQNDAPKSFFAGGVYSAPRPCLYI